MKLVKATISRYTSEAVCILLMALFGMTAVDKFVRFGRFERELQKSPFLMDYPRLVAWSTPLIEIIVVILLTKEKWRLPGLYASVFLMGTFTAYIYMLLNYSYYTPCLCSAAIESLSWKAHLVLNTFFLLLAVTGVLIQETKLHKS